MPELPKIPAGLEAAGHNSRCRPQKQLSMQKLEQEGGTMGLGCCGALTTAPQVRDYLHFNEETQKDHTRPSTLLWDCGSFWTQWETERAQQEAGQQLRGQQGYEAHMRAAVEDGKVHVAGPSARHSDVQKPRHEYQVVSLNCSYFILRCCVGC